MSNNNVKLDKDGKDKEEDHQRALERGKMERHNERVKKKRQQKKKMNFAIGSVFPSAEKDVEQQKKAEEDESIDPKALKWAVDYVFQQGYTLGLESQKRLRANDHEHVESGTLNDDASQAPSQVLSQAPSLGRSSVGTPRTPSLAPSFQLRPGISERSSSLIPPFVTKSSFRTIRKEPEGKKHQIGGPIPDQSFNEANEDDKEIEEKSGSYKDDKYHDELDIEKSKDDDSLKSANARQNKQRNENFRNLNSDEDEDEDEEEDNHYEGQIGGELENKHEEAPEAQERVKEEEDPNTDYDYNWWFRVREVVREPLAEFLATCIAIIIGLGANTQTMVYTQNITSAYSNRNLASSLGATAAIYIAGGVSGAHINPAITLMLAIFRGFPWTYVPRYFLAQLLGAFVGASLVWACYGTDITYLDPGHRVKGDGSTAGLFVIQPFTDTGTPVGVCVFQEILAGAILTVSVLALGDADNAPPGASLGGLIIGLVIYSIGTAMGSLSGYATNPVRDLSPRIFLAAVGYSSELWTHDSCWFVIGPLLGTFAGTILGATIYDTLIYIGVGSPINFNRMQWRSVISRAQRNIRKTPSRTARRSHNMVRYVVGRKDKDEKRRQEWDARQKKGEKAV